MNLKPLSSVFTPEPGQSCLNNGVLGTSYVPDDADGNMTAKIDKKTGDSTVFTWDIENKLTEVRKPGMIARFRRG
jgi:hypothetical protein